MGAPADARPRVGAGLARAVAPHVPSLGAVTQRGQDERGALAGRQVEGRHVVRSRGLCGWVGDAAKAGQGSGVEEVSGVGWEPRASRGGALVTGPCTCARSTCAPVCGGAMENGASPLPPVRSSSSSGSSAAPSPKAEAKRACTESA